jgi:hypothetical protein
MLTGAALIGLGATAAGASIFHQDDRQYVSPGIGSPYSSVGLVRQGSAWSVWRSYTTGFLVDDCHVLTSQVALGFGQAPIRKRVKFETGIGTAQHQSTGAVVVAAGGLKRHETWEERSQPGAQGWLLLRLDRCIGASLGHVTLKTGPFSPYEFRDLKSAGYPVRRSRKSGLTIDPSCRIIGSRGSIWLNDCAAVKADGGDPIFRIARTGTTRRMEVYAMQMYAGTNGKPVPLTPGYENGAVPMSAIAPQIERFLTSTNAERLGDAGQGRPVAGDALSGISTGAGVPSDRRVLDTRMVTADTGSHSESRTQ